MDPLGYSTARVWVGQSILLMTPDLQHRLATAGGIAFFSQQRADGPWMPALTNVIPSGFAFYQIRTSEHGAEVTPKSARGVDSWAADNRLPSDHLPPSRGGAAPC